MGILDFLFGKKSNSGSGGQNFNAMGAANPYLSQIPGVGHNTYDPYIASGKTAQDTARTQYDAMTNDPTGFIDLLMKNFKTSEGYGFEKDKLEKELSNAANAGGIAGTPADFLKRGEAVQGLLSKDMQQYLLNALKVHGIGLEGEQGVANTGYDAAKALNDLLAGNLNQEGGLAFNNAVNQQNQYNQQQTQKSSDKNALFKALAKALGVGAGAIFGGGLPGAAAGGKIASGIFG